MTYKTFAVLLGLIALMIVAFALLAHAENPHEFFRVHHVDPDKHTVVFQPMHPNEFGGVVIDGSFVEDEQIKCEVKVDRVSNGTVQTPAGGETHLTWLVFDCKGHGRALVHQVLFTDVDAR